jgi:RND superfamily putative drug exporter
VTRRLTAASARHPWRTIAAWLAVLTVAAVTIVLFLGDALTTEQEVTNNPESQQAYDLIAERVPADPDRVVDELVLVRSDDLMVDDPGFRRKVEAVAASIEKQDVAVNHMYEPGQGGIVSRDRHATVLTIGFLGDAESDVEEVVEAVQRADDPPFEVFVTGEWTVNRDFNTLSQDDLKTGELQFGLPVALIVLLLVFGAVVAGLVPLLMALASILVALALAALVGQAFELSVFLVNMLTGMGLALGIDYALFIVSRFREERAKGTEKLAAIDAAGRTASRAVVFSGVAFVLAMFGMVLVPDTILRSLAAGAILVGAVSVVAALTLLPAILSLLGDRVNGLRIPVIGRSAERGTGTEGRFWSAIVRTVMRFPVATLAASAALLLALAAPIVDLEEGFVGIGTVPDRFESKQGFLALERSFGIGTTDSVQVVIDGEVPRTWTAANQLASDLRNDSALRRVSVQRYRDLVIVEALPAGDSHDEAAYAAVERIRDRYAPERFDNVDARVLVTGETAESLDYFALVDRWLPIVFAFVLSLSFVLLTIAFRSLVVALKAIVLNLLSVGAAYGLLVLVFQKGIGNELFGFQQVDTIEAWVPLFLFSVLFGLSMDYHVFLLSRIRERFTRTGDNDDAVLHGVASTARLITGAALIIIAVFSGFARGDLVMFQQMGFGVAVSLLIDATIVRSVLLPASMKLLGDWNWYLPKWLQWLPDLEVEGGSERR